MVSIVDYGMGNLLSVYNALDMLAADAEICDRPEDLADADRIILPGVGAFRDCIANLIETGFRDALNREVLEKGKPIYGICLGMQAMAKKSYEFGEYEGLGWFDAEVVNIHTLNPNVRVPQVGWNAVDYRADDPYFKGLPAQPDLYFVHSFYMKCNDPENVVATAYYGGPVTAAVRKDNIFASQFHPEKSQDYGLQILENFLNWNPG